MMKTKTKLKLKNNWKTKTKTKNKPKRKSHCYSPMCLACPSAKHQTCSIRQMMQKCLNVQVPNGHWEDSSESGSMSEKSDMKRISRVDVLRFSCNTANSLQQSTTHLDCHLSVFSLLNCQTAPDLSKFYYCVRANEISSVTQIRKMRWKMSAPRIIWASLPSFCQKLSKLVEIWRSSDKNNFAQIFLRHGVVTTVITSKVTSHHCDPQCILRHATYALCSDILEQPRPSCWHHAIELAFHLCCFPCSWNKHPMQCEAQLA